MKILCSLIVGLLLLGCSEEAISKAAATDNDYSTTQDGAQGDSITIEEPDIIVGVPPAMGTEDYYEHPEMLTDAEDPDLGPDYPEGPHGIELFKVMPDMTFYNPWEDLWINLSDFYQSEEHRALLVVSSAGWCGPCLMESAALIGIYEKYKDDGLEILYTLGNTNILNDVPFDQLGDESSDLEFMQTWIKMAEQESGKIMNYTIYADPLREFLPYLPNHAWPLSVLVTTKDMGIRLVEEGYWSALLENKINLVLYNDVPEIPFE